LKTVRERERERKEREREKKKERGRERGMHVKGSSEVEIGIVGQSKLN
jgi:hypothetical protein